MFSLFILLPSVNYAQDLGGQSDQKFEGFNLDGYSEGGEKTWDVTGETANIVGTEIELTNVVANTYDDETMNITADTGRIDQTKGTMFLQDDVIITSENGSQLLTDSLSWDKETSVVSTEDKVLITDERMTVSGKGIKANTRMKTAKVLEDVRVLVNTDSEKKDNKIVTITSDGPMEIDQALFKATFEDNVVAVQDNQTLKADRMEIYFGEDMGTIKEMICIGNVEILQGENKSYANKATYDAERKKLILSGRPKLIVVTEGDDAIKSSGD